LKYKISCKSLLLQKALESFLEQFLDEDGDVISDEKGDILIGKDIKKPFSKSTLLIQLENIENRKKITNFNLLANECKDVRKQVKEVELSFDEKVDNLVEEFSKKLKKLIKEEYGKK